MAAPSSPDVANDAQRRHRAGSLPAVAEAAGAWWLVVTAGLLVLVGVLLAVQRLEGQSQQDARLGLTLQEIREHLETDLALGLDLASSSTAQALLEDMIARDATLLAAEVFDAEGLSVFSTDRGAIGESVPVAWLAAAGRSVRDAPTAAVPWSAGDGGTLTLGLPIRGTFGEAVGHISVTQRPFGPPTPWNLLLLAAAAWLVGSLASGLFVHRWLLARHARADETPLRAALLRLSEAQQRLQWAMSALSREEDAAS